MRGRTTLASVTRCWLRGRTGRADAFDAGRRVEGGDVDLAALRGKVFEDWLIVEDELLRLITSQKAGGKPGLKYR